jgi:phenylalanyl-tRNA synthetase alpha chain
MPIVATPSTTLDARMPPNENFDPVEVAALQPEAVDGYVARALAAFAGAGELAALHDAEIAHDGDRSPIALANREIGALPPAARKAAGQRIGAGRAAIRTALQQRRDELTAERDAHVIVEEAVDVTLPTTRHRPGARHPISTVMERLEDIFVAMGYGVAEGPEVDASWLNFDALNTPADHPSRDTTDTFWVESLDSGLVLRTQTSPVQIREMLRREPPIYIVCPGKTFRTDELDATHTPVFHQIEGLVVDEGITMAHLKGTLDHMAEQLFGPGERTRLRPHYFPFTEPSAEMDLLCFVCRGESVGNPDRPCRTCSSEGWIEWGGCGLVDPRVLIACGIDPDKFSGFAFGMGIERSVMFRHDVSDMRDIIEGDVRFSAAFGIDA